jgi:Asp-tRNA(Asn)/Glu-tRNA(Gln) amidotransferase A subunit family amidase
MIDLPSAPAPTPDETVTTPARPAAAAAAAAAPDRSPSDVDLTEALDRTAGARRPVGEGGAWVRVRDEARAEAAARGRPAGPLERTIVAVKDLAAVRGLPLGAGSRARADAPVEVRDADVVRALRVAGAVIAGTVALHEMAFGVTGVNDEVGFPPNPHDAGRVPGGSSSGSAVAVAEGTCDLAVGTDTGGSVRIPAALCGVVGFKPAGRYPLDGVLPLAPTLDQVGFLAPSVAQVAAAHQAFTGDPPPASRAIGRADGARIGVEAAALAAADGPVAAAVEAALRRLRDAGCQLVDVDWPDRAEVLDVSTTIMFAEAAAVHRRLLDGPAASLLGAPVAARFRAGAAIGAEEYRAARSEASGRLTGHVHQVLQGVDAVVGPTVPIVAPTVEDARRDDALPRRLVAETRLANVARAPALTIPLPTAGLPVGLQVTAASDGDTLAIGSAIATLLGGLAGRA